MRVRTLLFAPATVVVTAAAFFVAAPSTVSAQILLNTDNGFLYDISDTGEGVDNGQLVNGTDGSGSTSAYAGAYVLEVARAGGALSRYSTGNRPATPDLAARKRILADWTVPATAVVAHREVYVPATDGEFARYVDVFENEGGTDVDLRVRYSGMLGDTSARVRFTADGNTNRPGGSPLRDDQAQARDLWVLQDDGDARGIPSIITVIRGPESQFAEDLVVPLNDDTFRFDEDELEWEYEITVPAGETRALMLFAIQAQNRDAGMKEADRISGLPDDALLGIDEQMYPQILNWRVGNIPRIVFDGPVRVEEGEAIVVGVQVDDLDGAMVDWSFDLPTIAGERDGDEVFDDGDGLTEMVVPAEFTDGDKQYRLFVRARNQADPTKERIRSHVVIVENVPPVITSLPPSPPLFVGSTYVYDIRVDDAPAEFQIPTPLSYGVFTNPIPARAPTGMEQPVPMEDETGPLGRLTWLVQREHRDQTFDLVIRVSDAAGGEATQEFRLRVSDNLPPDPPTIIAPLPLTDTDPGPVRLLDRQPTLVIENATDPEDDAIRYHFRVATESDFSEDAIIAGTQGASENPPPFEMGIEEDPSGETSWTVSRSLDFGTYFWEVRAVDEEGAMSQARFAVFNVRPPETPDAGPTMPPRSPDNGGCNCAVEGRDPAGLPRGLIVLVGLALAVARRRPR